MASYANNFRKPLYVLCQGFKFSMKSKIDGLILNNSVESIFGTNDRDSNQIALTYDLTPQKYISLVISEIGIIPPTSASIIIREFKKFDTHRSYSDQ